MSGADMAFGAARSSMSRLKSRWMTTLGVAALLSSNVFAMRCIPGESNALVETQVLSKLDGKDRPIGARISKCDECGGAAEVWY
eukprot:3941595-Rhodomonas_salina.3